jgi:Domain of unknown function (DUF1918)
MMDGLIGGCAMVSAGDRVIVDGRKVGHAARTGVVTAVSGTLVTVCWDDGHVTTFAPTAATMTVGAPPRVAEGRQGPSQHKGLASNPLLWPVDAK